MTCTLIPLGLNSFENKTEFTTLPIRRNIDKRVRY